MIELKVQGELCSKSNSRRIVNYGGHPRVIKSQKALDYEYSSTLQIKRQLGQQGTIEGQVSIEVHVWYASRRPDLDIALIQDVLQKAGVYKNDRQVFEIHAFKYLDKENPRVLIRIREIEV